MEVTLEQALQNGVKAHKSGQIQEADRYYTAILKVEPKHPDANHNMGVLAVGVGKLKEALPFFKTALDVNPNIDQFWFSYLDVLIRLDRLKDAELLLKQAKDHGLSVEALNRLRGMLSKKNKQTTRFATVVNPPQTQVQSLLDLFSGGEFKKVISNSEALLTKFPNSINLYNLIGASNKSLGNLDQAIEAYQKAINIKPDYAEAYFNLGNALQDKFKFDDAIDAYKRAINLKSDYAQAYHNLGAVYYEQDKLEQALDAYDKALAINPTYAEVYHNILEILKTHSIKKHRTHAVFRVDGNIKQISHKLSYYNSELDTLGTINDCFDQINANLCFYKTPLTQIYKRSSTDLKCNRHYQIFEQKNIIPEFCFGCFKVQLDVDTLVELIHLTSLFYDLDFEEELITKTMVELRPNIPGFYKGLVFCRGLNQAEKVKSLLERFVSEAFQKNINVKIKRGCSEFPLKYPNYGRIDFNTNGLMPFPDEWRTIEAQFDQNYSIKVKENCNPSLPKFCLSDLYIIDKWVDYAKAIQDNSVNIFSERDIRYHDIYETAKTRILPA